MAKARQSGLVILFVAWLCGPAVSGSMGTLGAGGGAAGGDKTGGGVFGAIWPRAVPHSKATNRITSPDCRAFAIAMIVSL